MAEQTSSPPKRSKVFLNVDLGEGYGNFTCGPDEELIPMIDHANVACGFHAGDPLKMQQSIRLCKQHNVKVGAHPGLPDVLGFGRREMRLDAAEHAANVMYQVGALRGFLDAEGVALHHVKPHGALYGLMCRDEEVCRAVMRGIAAVCCERVRVFGLAGTCMETVAREMAGEIEFVAEVYADVKYRADGSLVIERRKGAWALEQVKERVRRLVAEQEVVSVSGEVVRLPSTEGYSVSVCCHSDSPGCVEIVRATREVVDGWNRENGFSA